MNFHSLMTLVMFVVVSGAEGPDTGGPGGITDLPPLLPHPDQVKIDMNTGITWIEGPVTKDDLAEIDDWVVKRDGFKEDLQRLRSELKSEQSEKLRTIMRDDVIQKILDLKGYPGPT